MGSTKRNRSLRGSRLKKQSDGEENGERQYLLQGKPSVAIIDLDGPEPEVNNVIHGLT